ncbi:hypothetical protein OROHE_024094 [Orobanche hederae]
MSKETKARVASAFRAMKAIGISEDKVKPVLKDLLKLYDKNWAYIEEENYRVLADTIFDRDEADAVKSLKKKNVDNEAAERSKKIVHSDVGGSFFHKEDYLEEEAQAAEEPERPLKRSRRKYTDGQGCSRNAPKSNVIGVPLITPKEEPNELPETCLPNLSDGKSKGVQPISPQAPSGDKSLVPVLTPERKSVASGALIKPKDEPVTDDMPHFAVPIVIIHPGILHHNEHSWAPCSKFTDPSEEGNSWSRTDTVSLLVNENEDTDGTMVPDEPREKDKLAMITARCSNLEVASSPLGDVRISLSCDLALGSPDFHIPNHETVRKLVEGKCLRSYKILDPNTSVMNLMKEMCRGFMKKSSGTNVENKEDEMNMSLVVYKQPNVTPAMIKSRDNVVDVANGQEKFVVTIVNEVDDEGPPSFYYIPKNVVFKNAYMNFSLARIGDKNCCPTCSGDCLLSSKQHPCPCAHASGGEFAYTSDGLVKEERLDECISMSRDPKKHRQFFCKECPRESSKGEDNIEPCKGHVLRKFIKECWWKCGCDMHCGNRVVQRGISGNLQVFMTPEGKGWGLRSVTHLPKGAFVCEYVGEILTKTEFYDRVFQSPKGEKKLCPVLLDADWGAKVAMKDEEALCLDATYYGNVGRFINHRCYDSNVVDIPVEVETPDHIYYHVAFFTTRNVNAMEELTWDYGVYFDEHDHSIKAFRCQCGSKFCRDIKHLCKTSWN